MKTNTESPVFANTLLGVGLIPSPEIQIKAWDPEGEIMLQVTSINFPTREFDSVEMNGDWMSFDDVVFRLYTGLKDKNGSQIYMGDVLKIHVDDSRKGNWPNPTIITPIYRNYFVKPKTVMGFDLESLSPVPKIYESGSWEKEIIGNIYENPELLTLSQPKK